MKPFARPISVGIVACIVLSIGVAVALASTETVRDGSIPAIASLRRCKGPVSSATCFVSARRMRRCPSSRKGGYCRAVSAFIGDAQELRLVRHAYLGEVLTSLKGVSAFDAESGRLADALPVLRKPQTATELEQLASLQRVAIAEPSSVLIRKALKATEANLKRARRFYYDSASGEAQYVVPGAKGAFCTLNVDRGGISRMGCSKIGGALEEDGTIAMTVLKGGYELSGLLPRGARKFRIVSANHEVLEAFANRWGGFQIAGKGVLMRFEARMRSGRWRVIVDTPFPPLTPQRESKARGHASTSSR